MVKILTPISSYEGACSVIVGGANEIYCGVAVPDLKEVGYTGLSTRDIKCSLQTYDELEKVVRYAHQHNVRVLVTTEFPFMADFIRDALESHICSCAEIGIDALIATDIGIILMAGNLNINTPIYASTYLASMNYEAVNFLKQLGVQRVMLERHVTIDEIKEIVQLNKDVEIEVFAHGTGCANINVNCYGCGIPVHIKNSPESYKVGTLCTSDYEIFEVKGLQETKIAEAPILDACSWCSLCKLPELVESGIVGLKIVGREFDIEYQTEMTIIYRELVGYLEQGNISSFHKRLKKIKNQPQLSWVCQQKRCYYSNLFHAPYKIPPSTGMEQS